MPLLNSRVSIVYTLMISRHIHHVIVRTAALEVVTAVTNGRNVVRNVQSLKRATSLAVISWRMKMRKWKTAIRTYLPDFVAEKHMIKISRRLTLDLACESSYWNEASNTSVNLQKGS